ncbi:NAD-dependent epimerase/dehydratase family protein [Marinilabiliaceae bacterium ANBcel2]|nr:NAD-dependent epimerase/dehydratase family protein [Marinilabiliaceae bacterium ANBcel2]
MILVTGGTGLVGSHLLYHLISEDIKTPIKAIYRKKRSLNDAKNVFAYYNEKYVELWNKIEWVKGDLSDYNSLDDALKGVTKVYHSAAMVSFNPGEANKMIKTNIEGTANLMNACIKRGVEKFCYVSSVSSLGKKIDGAVIDENVEWLPDDHRSAYSYSKFRSEMEVWRATKEGLPAVIVNPSVIIGPVSRYRSSGRLFNTVQKGIPVYTSGVTGFIDVRDVAKALKLLMESDIKNERFLLNSENLSFKDFFNIAAAQLGKKAPFIKASKWVMESGWRLNLIFSKITGTKPILTKDTARAANIISLYSSEKFKKTFNYKFIPIKDAVQNAAKWFKQ